MAEAKKCVTEVFSRVCGFFRPVQSWNKGKGVQGEFSDRKTYEATKFVKKKEKK